MTTRVRLFISAGPDQEPERELLGRALAEMPINVGWLIKRTPDVESVAESHLFVILIGSDIWAPVGLELYWARRTEKPILAYRAEARRTPAGQAFVQENALLGWESFTDFAQLRRRFLLDLSRFLAAHADRYGLSLMEGEMLREFLRKLDAPAQATVPAQATGASGGGVILAPGKDVPAGARVVGES